jgi:hypothetical protein
MIDRELGKFIMSLSLKHATHLLLFFHLLAYSFRLTPDQWDLAEFYCHQNKVLTGYIESDAPVYAFFSSPEANRFATGRDNRESSCYETPDFTPTYGVCGIGVSAAGRKKHTLLTEYLPVCGRAFRPGSPEPRLPGLKVRPHEDKITPQYYIGLPIKACYYGHILTSADRIVAFQHRATPLASSSDDDLLS